MIVKAGTGQRIETKKLLGHIIVFTALIFIIAAFQASFFGAAGFFNSIPDLLLSAVLAVGFTEGEKHGAACGIWAGVMAGALGGSGTAFLPVFYMLTGYFCGILIKHFLSRNFPSWLIYMIFAVILREMLSFITVIITEMQVDQLHLILKTLIPEAIFTYIFSVPVYFTVRLLARPFRNENQNYEFN